MKKRGLGLFGMVKKMSGSRRREEKRRRWIEIGRDATAFFSDLNFRFLLMHYIYE